MKKIVAIILCIAMKVTLVSYNKISGEDISGTKENSTETESSFDYASLQGIEFCFSSGAGGWETTLSIQKDGSFQGEYYDCDMGDTGTEYPNGVQYDCVFQGQFDELSKVDDLTYKTKITSISYENEVGTEEIKDGIRYIYTDAYGLDDAGEIYFYLKGTETSALSGELMNWLQMELYDYTTGETASELPFIAMYNENAGEGFFSYDISESMIDDQK